ncbi:SIR2 family protein [Rhizobium leguminosarum]
MYEKEEWNSNEAVIDFLAERLSHGHVLPVLGSGVSKFADLPGWDKLLNGVAHAVDPSYVRDAGSEAYTEAENILYRFYGGERQKLFASVHKYIYQDVKTDELSAVIRADPGMRALTMLCHRSIRGGSRFIVTLNYDDILEAALREMGLVVQSVGDDKFLLGDYNVSVLHPHGLLPMSEADQASDRSIVFSQSDATRIYDTSWGALLEVLLSKSFPVLIGVGGADLRLADYLDKAAKSNFLSAVKNYPYFGVRLCSSDDKQIPVFEGKGYKCIKFGNLRNEWPLFVETICKRAAFNIERRMGTF